MARFAAALTVAALLLGVPGAANGASQLWTYPLGCPKVGDNTLQQCIIDARPGDGILIEDNDLKSQTVTIAKSINLVAESGYQPDLAKISIRDNPTGPAVDVSLTGLTVEAEINSLFSHAAGDSLTLTSDTLPIGIRADVQGTATASITISNSSIGLDPLGGGIDVAAFDSTTLTLDVTSNRLIGVGSSNVTAIAIQASNAATATARLRNNLISAAATCFCGNPSGITLVTSQTATLTASVTGNTIDRTDPQHHSQAALLAVNDGTRLTAFAFDNVFSRSGGFGVDLQRATTSPAVVFVSGYNDFWHNGLGDSFGLPTAGAHTLHVDPMYTDPPYGDFRLQAGSPLVDAGLVCAPGGIANPDGLGHERLHGASVDIGAFERGAGAPTGKIQFGSGGPDTLSGTADADILCGMSGSDAINGGGGDDYLDGGAGNDTIVGGTGRDRIFGEVGNDTLCANDGAAGDSANGGPGTDLYKADTGDKVSAAEVVLPHCP